MRRYAPLIVALLLGVCHAFAAEDSEEFRADVANNQPLEYWGNKLIMVSRGGE